MDRYTPTRQLHHDLRGALSAVRMNLQTMAALEAGESDVTPERRQAILARASHALEEALEVAERLREESSSLPRVPD